MYKVIKYVNLYRKDELDDRNSKHIRTRLRYIYIYLTLPCLTLYYILKKKG